MHQNNERKDLYIIGLIGLGIGIIYLIFQRMTGFQLTGLLPPCIFHEFTGLYCPGCGGTRAIVLLSQGHFVKSFLMHPLVVYFAVLYAWFMITTTIECASKGRRKIGLRYHQWYVWVGVTLLALHFITKNGAILLGDSSWMM